MVSGVSCNEKTEFDALSNVVLSNLLMGNDV